MKPFRRNVAIAIDGGGIRGVIATQALSMLEQALGKPLHEVFRLAAGTSTGSIISSGIASGMTAPRPHHRWVEYPLAGNALVTLFSRFRKPGNSLSS
jgi:predicted acylesterase/phospholipase RssA